MPFKGGSPGPGTQQSNMPLCCPHVVIIGSADEPPSFSRLTYVPSVVSELES
ncbi:Gm16253 [Phodopus roborovskii]|uniref:Gm16253 protein n=1 Tax=Phodopus roborovskii TaxID=109678 RepID=A0AAU9ZZN3_PHORO|nr:Gm16253 [Phodopus roborovskii]